MRDLYIFPLLVLVHTIIYLFLDFLGVENILPLTIFNFLPIFILCMIRFIFSNFNIKIEKIFFFSGVSTVIGIYWILTILLSLFYKQFTNIDSFVRLNLIMILIVITVIYILFTVGRKMKEREEEENDKD